MHLPTFQGSLFMPQSQPLRLFAQQATGHLEEGIRIQ